MLKTVFALFIFKWLCPGPCLYSCLCPKLYHFEADFILNCLDFLEALFKDEFVITLEGWLIVSCPPSWLHFRLGMFSSSHHSVLWEVEQGSVLPLAVLICPSAVCSAERTSGLVVDYPHGVSGSIIDPLPLTACGS